ncbi:MAG: Hsp33 family molecular chaperone HslO [Panacagrimonas sp.]|nr:Hsp33 family molecular chaperone HslO [Panacagrimonas sp.]MCC2655227.1 Hsp33 family molecular chaperone HslO [Panacagrimonas sp.]
MTNALTTFAFENHVAHGALVRLKTGVRDLLDHRAYPPDVRRLLGEAMAAMPLFATHLNFEGRINLQFQGLPETRTIAKCKTQLLVAQIDHQLRVRAMAKTEPGATGSFRELLEGGVLALMVEPLSGKRTPTQALVLIEGDRLEDALEAYFARSEQLPTLIRLAVRGDELAGFMLQRMPLESSQGTDEDWEHLRILASTLGRDELLDTEADRLLLRLFTDAPPLRRFEPREVHVRCNCDRAGIARLMISLGREEVDSIIVEHSRVSVTCEFCGRDYVFSAPEVAELFNAAGSPPSETRH